MTTKKLTKLLALYLPYILLGLATTNFGEAWRLAEGKELGDKIMSIDDLSFFIPHRLSVLVQLWRASLQHLSAFHKDCTFRIGDDVGTVHLHQIGLDEKARFSRT